MLGLRTRYSQLEGEGLSTWAPLNPSAHHQQFCPGGSSISESTLSFVGLLEACRQIWGEALFFPFSCLSPLPSGKAEKRVPHLSRDSQH